MVIGPSSSGKSSFALKLLENEASALGGGNPYSVTYLHGFHSSTIAKLKAMPLSCPLIIRQGLDPEIVEEPEAYFGRLVPVTESREQREDPNVLGHVLILDDLAIEAAKSPAFTRLLTQGTHHLKITLIFLAHSLFHAGKERSLQQQQASYFVLFKSPRAVNSILTLGSQMCLPKNELKNAYSSISKLDYVPLILDLHKSTPPELSILSHVLPESAEQPIYVYSYYNSSSL